MRPGTGDSWAPAQGSVLGSADVQKWGSFSPPQASQRNSRGCGPCPLTPVPLPLGDKLSDASRSVGFRALWRTFYLWVLIKAAAKRPLGNGRHVAPGML